MEYQMEQEISLSNINPMDVVLTNKHNKNLNKIEIQRIWHSDGSKPFTLIFVMKIINSGYSLSQDRARE